MTSAVEQLQRRLVERLHGQRPETHVSTIVVCPSLSFPAAELRKIKGIQFYEERLLCLTLLLDDPALHVIYPSSVSIDAAIVDYYLGWLDDPSDAATRLHLWPLDDPDPLPLADKLLGRPQVLAALRERIPDPDTSFLLPFNVTPSEARVCEELGVALYGPHPDLVWLGSKSGARAVAAEAGVAVFDGAGNLQSVDEIADAIRRLRKTRPDVTSVVAKLNNGFSGQGNVIIDTRDPAQDLNAMPAVFCAADETWQSFSAKVAAEGAVVEELARDPGTVSPSVQLRILPGGGYEVISTHDQILGGPDEQVYLGCRFPARSEYRDVIQEEANKVCRVLAQRGVIGSFGIDFVVVPGRGVFLSEINLRLGGTTHPFLMARYVSGGVYDVDSGQLLVNGDPRVYLSSDNISSAAYVGLSPAAVIAAVGAAGLAYDRQTGVGATLHLLGALPDYGKVGVVCIARSHRDADELYGRVVATIDALAAGG